MDCRCGINTAFRGQKSELLDSQSHVVMVATVVVKMATHDVAKSVLTSVWLSDFFFEHKVGQILREKSQREDQRRTRAYWVIGQVFIASSDRFSNAFDYEEVIDKIHIDSSRAHFWGITAESAKNKAVMKFRCEGATVRSSAT